MAEAQPGNVAGRMQISEDVFINIKQRLRPGANVYKGYQKFPGGLRPLAIKRVFPYEEANLREVRHLVELSSHPNVVQIVTSKVQEETNSLYIAMELCDSQNLKDYIGKRDKGVPLDVDETMLLTKQLVIGMKHIHDYDIIHGDVKPDNMLLSKDKKTLKVSDFGLSKKLTGGRSVTKRSADGTDGYRAPETYNSEVTSQKADVYSLGLTMAGLWSDGKHPFGDEVDLLNYNIKKNKNRDLSGLLISGVKGEQLLDLLERMLEFDPKKRPTMVEVLKHPFFGPSPYTDAIDTPFKSTDAGSDKDRPPPYDLAAIGRDVVVETSVSTQPNADLFKKMIDLELDISMLKTWDIIVDHEKPGECNRTVVSTSALHKGCHIFYGKLRRQNLFIPINGKRVPLDGIPGFRIPKWPYSWITPSDLSKFWPGMVVWLDNESLRLFVRNLTEVKVLVRHGHTESGHAAFIPAEKGEDIPLVNMANSVEGYREDYVKNETKGVLYGVGRLQIDRTEILFIPKVFPNSDDEDD